MESQENLKFPELATQINAMAQVDQDVREKEVDDPEFFGGDIDRPHTLKMKEIVSQIGWPTVKKVGAEASFNAWLLVQHADHDVDFQRECLALMKQEPVIEVGGECIAKLEDRVLVNSGQLQVYGTQFQDPAENNGKFIPRPIADAETVNDRREGMGLPSLEAATNDMYRKYKLEKPE